MTRPKAYSPVVGYKYQILQYDNYNREYDHLDYAKDKQEKEFLLKEYRLSGATGLKTIELPRKYWND
jgi:hypothetical protein